jgi:hypothetical protein
MIVINDVKICDATGCDSWLSLNTCCICIDLLQTVMLYILFLYVSIFNRHDMIFVVILSYNLQTHCVVLEEIFNISEELYDCPSFNKH